MGVPIGELPLEGVAEVGTEVLMPGSRGTLLEEGEKGSLEMVLCEGAEDNECGVAIGLSTKAECTGL